MTIIKNGTPFRWMYLNLFKHFQFDSNFSLLETMSGLILEKTLMAGKDWGQEEKRATVHTTQYKKEATWLKYGQKTYRHFSQKGILMASRHMKSCSTALIIQETQIKTTMGHPVRMAIIKKTTDNKCWQGCGEKGSPVCCWRRCKLVRPLGKTVRRSHKKWKYTVPPDRHGNSNSWVFIERKWRHSFENICAPQHYLHTVTKIWKQPKCLSINKWIKKSGIHTQEYYSAIKKNEMLPFATRQMNLEGIMLCQRRDPNFVCFCLYMEPNKVSIIKKRLTESENKLVVTSGEEDSRKGLKGTNH